MKKRIKQLLVEGHFLLTICKKIDYSIGVLARKLLYHSGEIQKNKIFVMTYDDLFTCNPRYIAEELLRQNLPVQIIWAVSPKITEEQRREFPPEIRLVNRGSFEMYEEMASAKIWIDNALNCVWDNMPKKKGQIYINTWHGSLGIKRLSGGSVWMRRARRCQKYTDFCISNSTFEEKVYKDTFWPETTYLRYGHARNDILFREAFRKDTHQAIVQYFGLEPDSKILLYAPTFRDDMSTDCFDLDYAALKKSLETRFGGSWTILVRMHFKNRMSNTVFSRHHWLKNATHFPDMQKLMVSADAGITDYSSWAYDYLLTRRPLFIYATDIDRYNNQRGLYYPLQETPFAIACNSTELCANIEAFDGSAYGERIEQFLNEKGCIEDGKASERIAYKIMELLK